jgi:hypothetical protein
LEDAEDSDDEAECIDQGDQIFASRLLPSSPLEDICALSTISTHLAEVFKANLEAIVTISFQLHPYTLHLHFISFSETLLT